MYKICVNCAQNVPLLYLERIICSSVVKVMAQACYDESQTFNISKYFPPLCCLQGIVYYYDFSFQLTVGEEEVNLLL